MGAAMMTDAIREELRAKLTATPERVEKFVRAEIKAVDAESFEVEAVISAPSIDRDREVIDPAAFRKAKGTRIPLVDGHFYAGVTSQIGDVSKLKIADDAVTARIRYLVGKGNEAADWGWLLVKEGLAAWSVGFIPRKWEDADLDDEKTVNDVMAGRKPLRRYTDVELLEVSQVVVPSNRDAVQRMVAKGVYTDQDAAKLEILFAKQAAPPEPIIEIADGTEKPEAPDPVEKAAEELPPVPSPIPVVDVSIKRIREEGSDAPEAIEIRSGEALVFSGTAEALVLALHAAKGEPHVKITVTHEHKVAADVPAETRAALVADLTSGLKEVTTSLQQAIAKLPTIPTHIAEYPNLKDFARSIVETVVPHAESAARRAALLEVAKATGNVDAHLHGR